MQIAIVSDSHDNLPNIDEMLRIVAERGITTMIHCGDVCAPGVLKYLSENFAGDIHLAYGNVDGDIPGMEKKAGDNVTLHGEVGTLELGGKTIVFNHYPDRAKELAAEGGCDIVFYGHTHKPWEEAVNGTRVVNPGTLAGLFAKPTFAIYNTANDNLELILLYHGA